LFIHPTGAFTVLLIFLGETNNGEEIKKGFVNRLTFTVILYKNKEIVKSPFLLITLQRHNFVKKYRYETNSVFQAQHSITLKNSFSAYLM